MTSRLLLLLLLLLPARAGAAEDDVAGVLAKVAAAYADAKTVSVELTQTSSGPSYFEAQVQTGSFVVQRPDRVRWELTGGGATNTWISDGTTLWIVQPAEKTVQVFKQVAVGIRRYIGFLSGLEGVQEDFEVTRVTEGPEAVSGRTVLRLKPRAQDEQLRAIYVQLDAAWQVAGVVLVTPFGDRTDMQLRGLKLDAAASDDAFRWTPQPGWHVVAMD
jgi:outer membrane lipoprotein-sorting protein